MVPLDIKHDGDLQSYHVPLAVNTYGKLDRNNSFALLEALLMTPNL